MAMIKTMITIRDKKLIAIGSLRALGTALGVEPVDGRRFRMNFGIEGLEPHEEDSWVGRRVALFVAHRTTWSVTRRITPSVTGRGRPAARSRLGI